MSLATIITDPKRLLPPVRAIEDEVLCWCGEVAVWGEDLCHKHLEEEIQYTMDCRPEPQRVSDFTWGGR